MGFVYLICDPSTDMFKIGVTRGSVEKRLKKLQTGNGTEIFLVNSYETDIPFYIEKSLHLHFFGKNSLNEWFCLNAEDIQNFENLCKKFENIAESLKDNMFFKVK